MGGRGVDLGWCAAALPAVVLQVLDPGVVLLVSFVLFFVFPVGLIALLYYRPGLGGRERRGRGGGGSWSGGYEGDAGGGFFGDGGSDGGDGGDGGGGGGD